MKLRSQGFRLCGHSLNILQHRLYRNLLDLAFREEDRAGRIFFDEGRVVRGHDYGATLTSDFLEQPNDAFGRQRIEVAGRFVGQKQAGTVQQGAGDDQTLLFAAGKLERHLVAFGFQRYDLEYLVDPLADF